MCELVFCYSHRWESERSVSAWLETSTWGHAGADQRQLWWDSKQCRHHPGGVLRPMVRKDALIVIVNIRCFKPVPKRFSSCNWPPGVGTASAWPQNTRRQPRSWAREVLPSLWPRLMPPWRVSSPHVLESQVILPWRSSGKAKCLTTTDPERSMVGHQLSVPKSDCTTAIYCIPQLFKNNYNS